ncbi:uncharacterized protein PFL1_05639 [Pseudozyma flocculosa PF-1]|uniref:SNF5-domain-containing protein n=1 Tax=Pseudozyma flocculosa PF-1 TaxID=1277687 RepID=A0A061H303_9BASI|nr:uncharacterized protein PFL1_05639 [Pseudozyma flocculosa PF-1]EPQ26659.1 hypothetical protein PFL1_05639 [Pseudozyma flocculosa PF-1]
MAAMAAMAKQGRRPSMVVDPNTGASPGVAGRRPSTVELSQANLVNPAFENLPLTDPTLAAAGAAPTQTPAMAHAMNQGMLGGFGQPSAPSTPRRPSQQQVAQVATAGVASGGPIMAPAAPTATPGAAAAAQQQPPLSQPPAQAPAAAQPDLSHLPMVQGGPPPRESAVGLPINGYNTRVTKLPSSGAASQQKGGPDGGDGQSSKEAAGDKDGAAEVPAWMPLTAEQEEELLAFMQRDKEYESLYRKQQSNMEKSIKERIDAVKPPRRKVSDGTLTKPKPLAWWERAEEEDFSGLNRDGLFEPFRILLPSQKRLELEQGQRGSRPTIALDKAKVAAVSALEEDLVPIRLEIDHEHWKLRDTFTWNALDSHIDLDAFAMSICEDIGLPAAVFVPAIKEQINAQIQDHLATNAVRPRKNRTASAGSGKAGTEGVLDGKDLQWWTRWRRTLDEGPQAARKRKRASTSITAARGMASQPAAGIPADGADGADMQVDGESQRVEVVDSDRDGGNGKGGDGDDEAEMPDVSNVTPAEELRMVIKLDITVGSMNLVDQFEWDAGETDPTAAETFAEAFAADLGLPGEFRTAIAHSIREQHPNIHDGMWHCSNCGIPGTLAPGRRKGPLGDKSLCGPCGKYYHRHRKVIMLDYTRDLAHHMKQQQSGQAQRKASVPSILLDSALLSSLGDQDDSTEPNSAGDTPRADLGDASVGGGDGDGNSNDNALGVVRKTGSRSRTPRAASPDLPFELVGSPDDSDSSSRSESPEPVATRKSSARDAYQERAGAKPPAEHRDERSGGGEEGELEEQGEIKGSDPAKTAPPNAATSLASAPAAAAAASASPSSMPSVKVPTTGVKGQPLTPAEWLLQSAATLRARYPNDRFEIQPRPVPAHLPTPAVPEWRVRCLDCPGKLYTPGPGESLNNFEIHLRNRQHRANVNSRVYGGAAGSPPPGAGSVGTPGSARSPSMSSAAAPAVGGTPGRP